MGVGMPAALWLNQFGALVYAAFGEHPYHVGSSVRNKDGWRDVDVRVMLARDVYQAMGLGDPKEPHANARWCALCLAFSALGKQMTGLPIDFQIQEISLANEQFRKPESVRSCLGFDSWGPVMAGFPEPAETDAACRQLMAAPAPPGGSPKGVCETCGGSKRLPCNAVLCQRKPWHPCPHCGAEPESVASLADFDQTPAEAQAELEGDGVDVEAFQRRVAALAGGSPKGGEPAHRCNSCFSRHGNEPCGRDCPCYDDDIPGPLDARPAPTGETTTCDVKGALARLWSAYPAAGDARGELRLVFALLGADPPEEDELGRPAPAVTLGPPMLPGQRCTAVEGHGMRNRPHRHTAEGDKWWGSEFTGDSSAARCTFIQPPEPPPPATKGTP